MGNNVKILHRIHNNHKKITLRPIKKIYRNYKRLRQTHILSHHFSDFFTPIVASDKKDLEAAHNIRHQVFCDELELFDKDNSKLEHDDYDRYAKQCLIQHKESSEYAGTVRIIMPETHDDIMPIEKIASAFITKKEFHPHNFPRHEVCEISRIAIPKCFRRRKTDQFKGSATAAINTRTYSEIELRCFPLIAVGLYMATAATAISAGKKHAFFMVEPRLARSMRFVGIKLTKIGDDFEYVGQRAPYYANYNDFLDNLSPSFKYMMNEFTKVITK
jgi:N-acyl amino acid synthase of PEP-CTERM/exosortase system